LSRFVIYDYAPGDTIVMESVVLVESR